eukprot:TRINITY_DN1391_c0_g2_i2.p1 TRINITY_DN1391_c0_g2~~TRINITY_DN1391_c0_g2_i2.p1  ORF type:complete len:662 (-),score=204.73 TRINITY_DN1391_c0_g2_i2:27-2012(-)
MYAPTGMNPSTTPLPMSHGPIPMGHPMSNYHPMPGAPRTPSLPNPVNPASIPAPSPLAIAPVVTGSGTDKPPLPCKIYIGQIPPSFSTASNGALQNTFVNDSLPISAGGTEFFIKFLEIFGTIYSWKRITDPFSGAPKSFGFLEYESLDSIERILRFGPEIPLPSGEGSSTIKLQIKADEKTLATIEKWKKSGRIDSTQTAPQEKREDLADDEVKRRIEKFLGKKIEINVQSSITPLSSTPSTSSTTSTTEGDSAGHDAEKAKSSREVSSSRDRQTGVDEDKNRKSSNGRDSKKSYSSGRYKLDFAVERRRLKEREERKRGVKEKRYFEKEKAWETGEAALEKERQFRAKMDAKDKQRQLEKEMNWDEDDDRRGRRSGRRRRARAKEEEEDERDRIAEREEKTVDRLQAKVDHLDRNSSSTTTAPTSAFSNTDNTTNTSTSTQHNQERSTSIPEVDMEDVSEKQQMTDGVQPDHPTQTQGDNSPEKPDEQTDSTPVWRPISLGGSFATKKQNVGLKPMAAGFDPHSDSHSMVYTNPKKGTRLLSLPLPESSSDELYSKQIPSDVSELFAFPVDWELLTSKKIVENKLKPWIVQKIKQLVGEEEMGLVEWIVKMCVEGKGASVVEDEVKFVLEEESGKFVQELWRKIVIEMLKEKEKEITPS